jgi:beta-fructofuranosidase
MKKSYETAWQALVHATPAAQSDPLRPRYHFAAPAQWMNDPNGTVFIKGEYHLFYQLNPYAPRWGEIHWGHAKSLDLVHWEHLPIALTPAYELDEQHCFSGCCVDNHGTPTIFYTSIGGLLGLGNVWRGAQQWKAFGDNTLTNWLRAENNPFVCQSMHNRKIYDWRDPYIWKDDNEWRMVLAGKHFGDRGGSVYLYTSPDLETWSYQGAIYQHETKGVECPNMLKFGGQYVLIVSPYGQVQYAPGKFVDGKFAPEKWRTLDHGRDFYATNTFVDWDPGYKLVGWIKVPGNGAWHGCLSLPRHLTLTSSGELRILPAAGLQSLRKQSIQWHDSGTVAGNCIEIKASFPANSKSTVGFILKDDEREYPLTVDVTSSELHVLNENRTLEQFNPSEPFSLHIFIDHSVVEVFVNERECLSTWVRPSLAPDGAWKIRLLSPVDKIEAWELAGSFNNSD